MSGLHIWHCHRWRPDTISSLGLRIAGNVYMSSLVRRRSPHSTIFSSIYQLWWSNADCSTARAEVPRLQGWHPATKKVNRTKNNIISIYFFFIKTPYYCISYIKSFFLLIRNSLFLQLIYWSAPDYCTRFWVSFRGEGQIKNISWIWHSLLGQDGRSMWFR